MCGIIGGNLFKSDSQIIKGIKAMYHRGTDQNVLMTFENGMRLAHNRLSIQDLSENAKQPMTSACGRYYIVFNGELWNSTFEKYNDDLRAKYSFKTEKSDTELLLYFLIEHKDNLKTMLREINGMFAFAFYDKVGDTLFIARDFIGRIPLYYYSDDNGIAFASEVKGLTECFEQFQYYKATRRSPKEIKDREKINIVNPGTLITAKKSEDILFGGYETTTDIWFSFKEDKESADYLYIKTEEELEKVTNSNKDLGLDHYASEFRDLLWKSVKDEMIADVPVCTILSGGIDSTIITYILAQLNPNIEAFVVHIGDIVEDQKDDLYYAKLASDRCGVKLNIVQVTEEQIKDTIKESIWACEGYDWRQVACSVAQLYLAKAIREKGFKVVFGGEGADEIFASYNDVKRWSWRPLDYHRKRVNLINKLHNGNLIRCNKVLMYGGEVELRTPFMSRELVTYGLTLPVRYRSDKDGKGGKMKYLLRKAFENDIQIEELVWRPKVTMQIGCHTDFLKEDNWKQVLSKDFQKVFQSKEIPTDFLETQFRELDKEIELEIIKV